MPLDPSRYALYPYHMTVEAAVAEFKAKYHVEPAYAGREPKRGDYPAASGTVYIWVGPRPLAIEPPAIVELPVQIEQPEVVEC